ncbi:MAG: hypothetical protein JWR38_923 [Mucilaginibacter sp.]|nr:hypothetical protein [Mucilaginibacter sp.]
MKSIKSLILPIGFIITVLSLAAFMSEGMIATKKVTSKVDGKGFAVIELFTSEGCSSCPPAGELLAKLQQEAQGKPVYILAYHVDYWNSLGWKDIFSNADYSKRQKQYGNWLTAQIYTPQVIVNGKAEFVGSDEPAIRNAISEQLTAKSAATLTLQAHQDGEKLQVQYQSAGAARGSKLLINIVQKIAQSNVDRGENAGRSLTHVQIVRNLQTESLNATGTGSATIVLPKGFNNKNWEILGLIQDQSNGEISAAAKADLNDHLTTGK